MAKNLKKSKEAPAPEVPSAASGMESTNGHHTAESAPKKTAAKPAGRAKSAGKSRGPALKKTAGTRKPRVKKESKRASRPAVTDEQIRIRAYFISEWRMQNGIVGDSARDWLEARRQLQAETAPA